MSRLNDLSFEASRLSIETVRMLFVETPRVGATEQAIWTESEKIGFYRLQPQPALRRVVYVSGHGGLEENIRTASHHLENRKQPLLAFLESWQGSVTARIFVHGQEYSREIDEKRREGHIFWSPEVGTSHHWIKDWKDGYGGYFLTGFQSASSLWRIERIDVDPFSQALLTLRPSILASELPDLNLDGIDDRIVRDELSGHYEELRKAVSSHSFRSLVTITRSIAESVSAILVSRIGLEPGRNLSGTLEIIKKRRAQSGEVQGFSDLLYHLAHKIRLVHSRTHVDRAKTSGGSASAGMALSCVEDLKELLRAGNFLSERAS